MGVENSSTQNQEWNNEINDILGRVGQLPKYPGPVFKVEAKGKKLRSETVFVKPAEIHKAKKGEFIKGNMADYIYYMFVRDDEGDVIATRITSLFFQMNKLVAKSDIKVRDKGKGLATAVDVMFTAMLQNLADRHNCRVEWQIENQNKEKLDSYAQSAEPDQKKLDQMMKEQQRWQTLYGPDGKFGAKNNRKIFYPHDTSTLDEIRSKTNMHADQVISELG